MTSETPLAAAVLVGLLTVRLATSSFGSSEEGEEEKRKDGEEEEG